jgi:hypothetical protein
MGKFSGAYYRTWSIAIIIRMGENGIALAVGLVAIGGPKALTSKKPLQKGGEAGPRRMDRIFCL